VISTKHIQFYDSPPDQQWWMKFEVLQLPADHRKILNRQPKTKDIDISGILMTLIVFDLKIMSN
jgi:hypothetical protein